MFPLYQQILGAMVYLLTVYAILVAFIRLIT